MQVRSTVWYHGKFLVSCNTETIMKDTLKHFIQYDYLTIKENVDASLFLLFSVGKKH